MLVKIQDLNISHQTILRAMQSSNPGVDPMGITVQSGQNNQVKQDDGSVALQNEAGVDWFAFQEALGRLGCMGLIDLEGPSSGSAYFNSEGRIMAGNFAGIIAIGIIVIGLSKLHKMQPFKAENIPIIWTHEMNFPTVINNKFKDVIVSPLGIYSNFDRVQLK